MILSNSIENHGDHPACPNRLRSFAACLLLSLSYLYFIIASAIELPFVNGDELIFLQYDDHSVCTNNGFYGATMIMGRALLALFYCQLGKFVYQLDDFSILRATAFVITASAMAGTMMVLRNLRLGSCLAFALSAAIFTLPGILYYILCAASAAPSPSPLVALVGYAVITNITPDDLRARPFSFKKVGWFLLAVLLLIASANFVQAGLCFFLVPTAAMLLFKGAEEWPDTRLHFLRDSLTFVTGTGLYYLVHRLIVVPLRLYLDPGHQEPVGSYQVIMPDTWSDKFDVFNIVNDRSLHLWGLAYDHRISMAVLHFLCLGFLSTAIHFVYKLFKTPCSDKRRSLCFYAIQILPVIIALLILVNLVSVVARFAAPRVMYPYQAVLVLAVFWAFASITQWLPGKLRQHVALGGALLLMMVGGVLGQRMVLYTAGNDHLAWAMVGARIAPRMDYLYAVHFIKFPDNEMGRTLTNTPIVSGSMESVMRSLAPLATNELIKGNLLDHRDILRRGVDGMQTFVTTSKPGEPNTAALPGSTFIDLNDFLALYLTGNDFFYTHMFTGGDSPFSEPEFQRWEVAPAPILKSNKNDFFSESGIATASTPNAAKLIDGIMDSSSMWDAGIAGWWKIDFGAGKTRSIAQYTLYGWDSSTNGPTEWTLDGSMDDINWTTLDIQKNVVWRDGEAKIISIAKPAAYRYYRLNILAPGKGSQARLVEMEMSETAAKH